MSSSSSRRERIAANEGAAREVNEEVGRGLGEHLGDPSGLFGFRCECGTADCEERTRLTLEEYEAVRADPMHFFVASGHVFPETERVIDRTERFWVLEKDEEMRAVVETSDPRRDATAGS